MHHYIAHHPRLTNRCLLLQTYETVVDGGCEQEHEFEIVRCTGHQHIGSRCITLYNADNGDRICQSCPVYGTEPGAVLPSPEVMQVPVLPCHVQCGLQRQCLPCDQHLAQTEVRPGMEMWQSEHSVHSHRGT